MSPLVPPSFDLTKGDLTGGDTMDEEEAPWTVPSGSEEYVWDDDGTEEVFDFPQDPRWARRSG